MQRPYAEASFIAQEAAGMHEDEHAISGQHFAVNKNRSDVFNHVVAETYAGDHEAISVMKVGQSKCVGLIVARSLHLYVSFKLACKIGSLMVVNIELRVSILFDRDTL